MESQTISFLFITLLSMFGVEATAHNAGNELVVIGESSFASQVTKPNIRYVIRHTFDLGGSSVTIPAGCVLEFDGGSLSNGTIVGNNTSIVNNSNRLILKNVLLSGNFDNNRLIAEWFIDDVNAAKGINQAIESAYLTRIYEVLLTKNRYATTESIILFDNCRLLGTGGSSLLWGYLGEDLSKASCPIIFVTKEVDGIVIKPYNSEGNNNCLNVVIKNIALNYNPSADINNYHRNTIKSNSGIHIHNYHKSGSQIVDGDPIIFKNARFEDVLVCNFRYGIHFQSSGFSGFSGCVFNYIKASFNEIGFYVEGYHKDWGGSSNKRPWMNCNDFYKCSFSWNYVGGVFVKGIQIFENNRFVSCVFELNGRAYNPKFLNRENFIGGYAYRTDNYTDWGHAIFDDCYFEWNGLRRETANGGEPIKGKEYKYDGHIWPLGIQDMGGYDFYLVRSSATVVNCRINEPIKIAYVHTGNLWMNNNSYVLAKYDFANDSEKDPYLIRFNIGNNDFRKGLKINELFDGGVNASILDYVKYLVKFENWESRSLFFNSPTKRLPIDINFPFVGKDIAINTGDDGFDLFVNNDRGNPDNLGIQGHPLKYISDVSTLLKSFRYNRSFINIFMYSGHNPLDNTSEDVPYPIDYKIFADGNTDGVMPADDDYHKRVYCTIDRKGMRLQGNTEFNNVFIRNVSNSSDCVFEAIKGDTFIFNNCDFDLKSSDKYLINCKNDNATIIFNNCRLGLSYTSSSDSGISIIKNPKNCVIYNNCQLLDKQGANAVRLSENERLDIKGGRFIDYSHRGSVRPKFTQNTTIGFEFFDTTINKPIYWTGTTWVDASGVMQ